jgi:hypothetical protein
MGQMYGLDMLRTLGSVCLSVLVVCSVVLAQQHPPSTRSSDADRSFARLRSKIDVQRVGAPTMKSVAGHYSSNSDELRTQVVPMGGHDLYLFPDGSYLYLEWSDIPPTTIGDKGKWAVSQSEVRLTSDPDIRWKPRAERHYLLIHRSSHANEILMVGADSDSRYFEQNAKDDPEFMLFLVSKARINGISEKEASELKEKLMRDAWRPDFYKSE